MVVFLFVMLVTTDTHRPLIHCGLKNDTLILLPHLMAGPLVSPYPPHCPVIGKINACFFHLFTIAWLFEFAFLFDYTFYMFLSNLDFLTGNFH